MAAEEQTRLQIGHVLFIDIVGYSKLRVNEQSGLLRELNEVVSGTREFREAEAEGKLIRLPTGDGMALVFAQIPKSRRNALWKLPSAERKSAHRPADGDSQRADQWCGGCERTDERCRRGHQPGPTSDGLWRRWAHSSLRHVAEDLAEYERWRPFLHDIGTFEVKHGVGSSVTNLYSDEVGNPNLPSKLQAVKKHHAHVRWAAVAIGLLVLGAIVAAFMIVSRRPTTSLTAIPEKSIAVLPFVDMSAGKDQEYFSDGISEELLNLLAKIPQLQVTARTSSFAFKGKEVGSRRSRARCTWPTCWKARCARRATRYGSRRS